MDALLEKSAFLVQKTETSFYRYLFDSIRWQNRLIGIKGQRGTGKTTILLQKLKQLKLPPNEAAYISLDDLYFTTHSLVETGEDFHKKGGKFLFLDEVHKYPGWAQHIKNLYDFYPDLKIIFTGSSIIDIAKEEGDLSRRARLYDLKGLSYREYLGFTSVLQSAVISLKDILATKQEWKQHFPTDFRPLQYFPAYLEKGYYPFFAEDPEDTSVRLQQLIRMIVEYDMAELHDFDIRNARKMLQLLYVLADNVPYKPNFTALADKSGIHRNTINNYLYFLQQAQLIHLLYSSGSSAVIMQKPEKVYLENTNLAYALTLSQPDKRNLRETFFLNQVSAMHTVHYSNKGDFSVDNVYTFEIGGKSKSSKQIAGLKNSFVVTDDSAFPVRDALPLWIFGFLY